MALLSGKTGDDDDNDEMISQKQEDHRITRICTVTNSECFGDGVAKPTLAKGLIIIMNVIKIKIYHLLTVLKGSKGLNCLDYGALATNYSSSMAFVV